VTSYIFTFVGAAELARICATCRYLNALGSQAHLWRSLCARQWPEQFCSIEQLNRIRSNYAVMDDLFWKNYFVQKYLLDIQEGSLSWTQISLTQASSGGVKPTPRYAHTGTVLNDNIIYIGGMMTQKVRFNDLYAYDTTTGRFSQPKVRGILPNISKHTTREINGNFYIFGGYDGVSRRFELFRYNPESQEWLSPETQGCPPPPRSNHCSAVVGNKMYIFGGLQRHDEELIDSNDMYYLDTDTMTWMCPKMTGDIPPPRCGHKMTTINGKIYLFGGGNGEDWINRFNDIHIFDPQENHWVRPTTTGMVPDSTTFASLWTIGKFLFVFGGGRVSDRGTVSNDVYTFDTVTFHWTKQTLLGPAPSPRDDCTTNVVGDTVYLMHGYNAGPINEFWSIQMSSKLYRSIHAVEPPNRTLKQSNSPLLTMSPSLKKFGQKFLSFVQREPNRQ